MDRRRRWPSSRPALAGKVDTLISGQDVPPSDPASWNAGQLRGYVLGSRHDHVYLAGHFSAVSVLAADYTTRMLASEVAASALDMRNVIIYSNGCHAGYNIVGGHKVPGLTVEPNWPQAFARKGALLIAGTGYQYGDTDLMEYSERLYLNFTRRLRTAVPVAVGTALVQAKQDYLADTAVEIDGVVKKSLLVSALYGLPMLSVQLPGGPSTASHSRRRGHGPSRL